MQQRLGRYELVERIASGGQGIVWRARDPNLNRIVAIKVLNQPVADDPRYLEALQREARLAAGLVHPNITAVHDFQVEGDIPYIVMEYVPDTLENHLRGRQSLPYQRAVEIAIQICRALSHAHAREIIHRDIKLQNILLTEEGNVKVSDFGIARALASSTRSSATGTMGTPFYMSPEQWGGGRTDGRADIYSLGILLYEMLTGSVPFRAENIGAMYVQHRESAIPEISAELGVPDAVEAVMRIALEKDPENRFNSTEAMANALQRSLNLDASPERPAPTPTPDVPTPPREPVATSTVYGSEPTASPPQAPHSLPPLLPSSRTELGFVKAVRSGFQHYFNFRGRSTRSEYWWWVLFIVLAGFILSVVDSWAFGSGVLNILFVFCTFIPGLAVSARRLHDINRSGWWLSMWLVFWLIIPPIILLVWATKQGNDSSNKYGSKI